MDRNNDTARGGSDITTIAGFLASAMDMEDEISNSVYRDYMRRDNWPPALDDAAFEKIKARLKVLIDDTQRHRGTFKQLQERLKES
jgi:hypothetical protein